MNRNYLIGFAVAAAVLALLAFAAHALFEIYPQVRQIPPSREARVNVYLALDRWLQSSGISVRVESSGDLSTILEATEKQIFIQARLFRWSGEAVEYLVKWIEHGGRLFLVLEMNPELVHLNKYPYSQYDWYGKEPLLLLEELGITTETGTGLPGINYNPEAPAFDHDVSFELAEGVDAVTLKDWTGLTRLVELKRGKGACCFRAAPFPPFPIYRGCT